MTIRQCRTEDLKPVAELHHKSFKGRPDIVSQNSASVIYKFYREFLQPRTVGGVIFLVHEERGEVNAFALGGEKATLDAARRRFYWKNLHRFAPSVISSHSMLKRRLGEWRNLFIGTWLQGNKPRIEEPWVFYLMAVSEEARGSGLIVKLWEAFEAALVERNVYRFGCSVAKYNKASMRLNMKMNCKVVRETDEGWQLVKDIIPCLFAFLPQI